ncbi:MAG: 4Fe-4S dicluster domain-containing protein [Planctomycetota bacterium]
MSEPMAILTDVTLCTGCEKCVEACRQEQGLDEDRPWPGQVAIDDLSSTRFTTVLPRPGNHFVRQQCRHCVEPACVSACIVGALEKTPSGAVVYDVDKCMGCRYCMTVCPYGIPRYDWEHTSPSIRKCNLCYERLQEGGIPACVESCPEEATIFGTRAEMLAEAHRRLAEDPDKYVPRVYGEKEVGGTSVLYVSDVPLDFLAWTADLGDEPLPNLSWASLKKVPGIAVGVGCLMAGTHWIIGRRMKLAAEHAAPLAGEDAQPSPGTTAQDGEDDHE